MNQLADELTRIDQAFAGNRLLSTFAPDVRAMLEPFGGIVALEVGDTVHERGSDVHYSVFPFGETMVSLIVELSDGRTIEAASIGREGEVQIAGSAFRVPMSAIEDAKNRSSFLANLFCRYSDFLLAQVMQSAACNAFHPIEQRTARWLLTAQDRGGDRIELTQEVLASLLGVQRTTLNAAVRTLQDEGLIEVHRGAVSVVDRARLKSRACECYSVLERHFADVIGAGGTGGGKR
jgi:DNA-binding transcriptional regulator YhcF (GntR family)